jgi:hypothetical protein
MYQQKFVVGDEYGVVSSFQMKRGEPQVYCAQNGGASIFDTNRVGLQLY